MSERIIGDNSRVIEDNTYVRHFKHKWYRVITTAEHTENGEELIVYIAMYGEHKVYVRPKEMFISEVDRVKYPDVKQLYRFETIEEIIKCNIDASDYIEQLSRLNIAIKSGASEDYISRQLLVLEGNTGIV